MDRDSRSSDTEELRDCVGSAEPSSIRPNPFEHDAENLRKRRRTASKSNTHDCPTEPDRPPSTEPPEDFAMTVDSSRTATPRSLDNDSQDDNSSAQDQDRHGNDQNIDHDNTKDDDKQGDHPRAPATSHVTLNLRNAERRTVVTIPSTPSDSLSPPQSPSPSQPRRPLGNNTVPEAPARDAADTISSPVEVIEIQADDDDDCCDLESPRIVLMTEEPHTIGNPVLIDPPSGFPYMSPSDTPTETMTRILNYITTDMTVSLNIREWIDSFLQFAVNASLPAVHEFCVQNRPLWIALPNLIWNVPGLRSPAFGTPDPLVRERLLDFCDTFARLTAFFVSYDVRVLRHMGPTGRPVSMDMMSTPYLNALSAIVKRDPLIHSDDCLGIALPIDDISEIVEEFSSFNGTTSEMLQTLTTLLREEVNMLSRFPRMSDNLTPICNTAAILVRESHRRLTVPGLLPQDVTVATASIGLGHQLLVEAVSAIETMMDGHITQISHDSIHQQLAALSDILLLTLHARHPTAANIVAAFHSTYPEVPERCIPQAYATGWRFQYYWRLIQCSQMQLRVMAVSSLCQELVQLWRRYGDSAPRKSQGLEFLDHLADWLERSGVIEYLLGPTCHPEIIAESFNVFGFLAVLRRFNNSHSDLFWRAVTTTQDPRISEAHIRSASNIVQLFSYEAALYMCRKFLGLPIAAFNHTMRNFCAAIFQQVCIKSNAEDTADTIPFVVCLRLLRDSSVPGTTTPTAHPEVQIFAIDKLSELSRNLKLDAEQRQSLYHICLSDLKAKSPTTLGSICAINILNRQLGCRDLIMLATDHGLTGLVVDEIYSAARKNRQSAFPKVIDGPTNGPRRDILFQIIKNLPSTLTADLSARLWSVMAGPDAACKEDRNASWSVILACVSNPPEENPFLTQVLGKFVPDLPPDCFCDGLLAFLRNYLTALLADKGNPILDPVDAVVDTVAEKQPVVSLAVDKLTLEQLWRVALTAPPGTIECQAIECLVRDVYIYSPCIKALGVQRAREVHLTLVNRCLHQLSTAATKLRLNNSDTANDVGMKENEKVMFIRSLQILQLFVRLYNEEPPFAALDIRCHIPECADSIDGESAELKYQSFNGDSQSEILPLSVGRRNTVGSLLASIREATGFPDYHMYYRGRLLCPQQSDVNRTVEDLNIQNGLILVKRLPTSSEADHDNILPSATGEIQSHFDELWEYLSMEDKLASGIYEFLSNAGGNERFLQFERADLSYEKVFIVGQPYKSLYALHALQGFVAKNCRSDTVADKVQSDSEPLESAETDSTLEGTDKTPASDKCTPTSSLASEGADGGSGPEPAQVQACGISKALELTIAAICDPKVTEESVGVDLRIALYTKLIDVLRNILNVMHKGDLAQYKNLDATLLARLMDILTFALDEEQRGDAQTLIKDLFGTILEVCALSDVCWDAFKTHKDSVVAVERLLFGSSNTEIQYTAEKQLMDKAVTGCDVPAPIAAKFRLFFWPIVLSIVPKALGEPMKCKSVLNLVECFMKKMLATAPLALDVPSVLRRTGDMLLSYTTTEVYYGPDDQADWAMYGLLRIFSTAHQASQDLGLDDILSRNFGQRLFWKHLFPPWRSVSDEGSTGDAQSQQKMYPRVVLHYTIREMMMKFLLGLVSDTPSLLPPLIRSLDQLVPCERTKDDDPYHYDLPQMFDRSKALRAPCGYAGLRNLSNTCYFNSLFTQLFMNVRFRQFMMNVDVSNEKAQMLLFQTRVLFAYLQDSVRRFVDTQMCVASVKSYDDTPIDIQIQMDVDEFYNLLFDRWEGQMRSDAEKKMFRTFYGGQLVQQVRSKDCEHVSERLDPFSAIQLEIKGKTSLAESLEAYVDGEVLEGDNKYKCSTCDRHVDAVKRSCLKEIPDNLIFHLKRFDFSLRTLQRSKINDYFSFPPEIDMRPYTIDHLSDPDKENTPDMFELVGVLVHSGTAESGHYYSFIRERPSSQPGNSWVEFNDEVVSAWDPAQMEALCFGGKEMRPNSRYGGDGSSSVVIDKAFSAYMLFYQRSSTLATEQVALTQAKLSSPARGSMPTALEEHIRSENTQLIRRHVLFDPSHILFVCEVLDQLEAGGPCSDEHTVENKAVEMAISHLDQVTSRTRDLAGFRLLHERVVAMCERCAQCSLAVVDYFDERPMILRQMLQRALEPSVRIGTGILLMRAFEKIKATHPDVYGVRRSDGADSCTDEERQIIVDREGSILRCAARIMCTLWGHFHAILRSWPEIFGFMADFVSMGREELAIFLEIGGFRRAIMAIAANRDLPTEPQYTRLLVALQRRPPDRPPLYEGLIALVDTMLEGMYASGESETLQSPDDAFVGDNVDRYALALQHRYANLLMTKSEFLLLALDWPRDRGNVFMERLISINQDLETTDAVLTRLMVSVPTMEGKLFTTLKVNISGQATAGYQEPFLRVARLFLRKTRLRAKAQGLLQHIVEQCHALNNPEGRAFFETMVSLYHGQTEQGDGQQTVDVEAILQGLRILPVWVPGLLGYYDATVNGDVETFLHDSVFRHGLTPEFSEEEGGAERAAAVVTAAKELGVHCLRFLRLYVVERNMTISQSKSAVFQRVLMCCRRYYEGSGAGTAAEATEAAEMEGTDAAGGDAATGEDVLAREFHELDSAIPDLLKRLAVEDIEEDGSVSDEQDWGSSRCTSEGVESVGDASMQTAAELHDVDML